MKRSVRQVTGLQGITDLEEEPPPLILRETTYTQYDKIKDLITFDDYQKVTAKYPFETTSYYLSLAENSPDDPVMKQLCPSVEELTDLDAEMDDPLEEAKSSPVPGLVHRYPDRVLLILTNVCFMNCRHCTRKRLWKMGRHSYSLQEIYHMIDYIKDHPEIRDVIISGGDPLTLSNEHLDEVLANLRAIPHVEIIRIGTRAPVVSPWRISYELLQVLKKYRPIWINTQFNHAKEITLHSTDAVQRIIESGIPVNNQSVLLKGINDNVATMTKLCHGLLKIGVRPYYLYHCDMVSGTSHFRAPIAKGIEIIEGMRGHTSGLAVPTFVVDAVRGGGKIPLQPNYLLSMDGSLITMRNHKHQSFIYNENRINL
ncbi:MAG: KamA family radical SAM protein [Candidatus Margulisbacteria bacterium]|nr:KamA family radical SAM protein [Candidatus Margulisiibacteriota bacterium]MBU1022148.1 KamA family radical SAM protein [Candidatus Margulisiibacteriota bacterium]MBU1729413.1 KamA family radical SAM protein [Candidatus Margulisiibacteriota bacterium]MBU1955686.1 KamA family radical SAM protein [Candidatus Margulisiibacteriota bacterium]